MNFDEGTRAIIKEIAQEVLNECKIRWDRDMQIRLELHTAQCEARKYSGWKHFVSSVFGGLTVAIFWWLFGKR